MMIFYCDDWDIYALGYVQIFLYVPMQTSVNQMSHSQLQKISRDMNQYSSFVSIIPELGHMFGQALAQWRALILISSL